MPSTSAASAIDHILLGCSDLQNGTAIVEQRTGVRPAPAGVHPGRGTRNALAALGERIYLEVIAPDPAQPQVTPWLTSALPGIATMTEPKIVGWAVRPVDIDALVDRLRAAGIAVNGPHAGSRIRGDGSVVRWKMARLADDAGGVLPFFMQWDADCAHPAAGAPSGCRLERFVVRSPHTDEVARLLALAGVAVEVQHGDTAHLFADVAGPRGHLCVQNETEPA